MSRTTTFKRLAVGQRFRPAASGPWRGLLAVKTGERTWRKLGEHRGTTAFTQLDTVLTPGADHRIGNLSFKVTPLGGPRKNPTDPIFGDVIHSYSRQQAIEDGFLVDVTEWASNDKGFRGGFTVPVAITRELWADLEKVPRMQDLRGRAHDVLWMARLAVASGMRRGMIKDDGGRVYFDLLLQVGRKKKARLAVDLGGGDDGKPVVTIGYPSDF